MITKKEIEAIKTEAISLGYKKGVKIIEPNDLEPAVICSDDIQVFDDGDYGIDVRMGTNVGWCIRTYDGKWAEIIK
tara:strand:+ start:80 stop:307 length:228 start_codon:yes stop_codon:yes gene_type:complete